MGDGPKDEVEQLRTENELLRSAGLEKPMERAAELAKLKLEVEELRKFKVEAEPQLTELLSLTSDTEQLTERLEAARITFCLPDEPQGFIRAAEDAYKSICPPDKYTPYWEEGRNLKIGAVKALEAAIHFLVSRGVQRQHYKPLYKLRMALVDNSRGIRNPITVLSSYKGEKISADEYSLHAAASWAVTGLHRLGKTKTKAYDIAAEAAGMERGALLGFRQDIMPGPKRRGPKSAHKFYDHLESSAPETESEFNQFVLDLIKGLQLLSDQGKN